MVVKPQAKGIDLNGMMAEILGKRQWYVKGKGGSMHIVDLDVLETLVLMVS